MSNVTACAVTGCPDPGRFIRGLCVNHYYRWRKHGDPLAGATRRGECLAYFWAHVDDETDDCIIWPYATRSGYGRVTIEGHDEGVHILACERHHGPRPDGLYAAAHAPIICHNRACAENEADKILDGTSRRAG